MHDISHAGGENSCFQATIKHIIHIKNKHAEQYSCIECMNEVIT